MPAHDQGGGADSRLRVSHRIVEQRRLQRHLPGHEAPEEGPERADQPAQPLQLLGAEQVVPARLGQLGEVPRVRPAQLVLLPASVSRS